MTKQDKKKVTSLNETVEALSKQLQYQDSKDQQLSESAQAIETLNRDTKDIDGFSSVDQHTEFTHNQVVAVTKLESLSKLDFSKGEDDDPSDDPIDKIVRIFQRKQVSKNRQGRKEAIAMFQEMEQKKDARGFWERWFSPKE